MSITYGNVAKPTFHNHSLGEFKRLTCLKRLTVTIIFQIKGIDIIKMHYCIKL